MSTRPSGHPEDVLPRPLRTASTVAGFYTYKTLFPELRFAAAGEELCRSATFDVCQQTLRPAVYRAVLLLIFSMPSQFGHGSDLFLSDSHLRGYTGAARTGEPCAQIARGGRPKMPMSLRLRSLLLLFLFVAAATGAQQNVSPPPGVADDGRIHFDVVLSPHSAAPVEGLHQQDFVVLDNKSPSPITSFHAFTSHPEPLEVVIVIDAVNSNLENVNIEHAAIAKFLRTEGGALAYPVALAAFTERGIQIVGNFSLDGNSLANALDNYSPGTRAIGGAAGRSGGEERWRMSQNAVRGLLGIVAPQRRRKIIVWLSPGWPELPDLSSQIDDKAQQQLFADVVSMSNLIGKAGATLYSIDPIGAGENAARPSYYKQFLDPVTKPSQVDVVTSAWRSWRSKAAASRFIQRTMSPMP